MHRFWTYCQFEGIILLVIHGEDPMKRILGVMTAVAIICLLVQVGAYAQSNEQFRVSCKSQPGDPPRPKVWSSDTGKVILDSFGKSYNGGDPRKCKVVQKRSFLRIPMPAKKLKLTR